MAIISGHNFTWLSFLLCIYLYKEWFLINVSYMAIMYSGITRPAPAPGGFKLLVWSHQARQVTSLGTHPQVGLSLPLSWVIQLWPPGAPVSRALLGWGDCVSPAGPGVLPSFLRLPSPKEQVGGTSVPLPDPGMSCLPGTLSPGPLAKAPVCGV